MVLAVWWHFLSWLIYRGLKICCRRLDDREEASQVWLFINEFTSVYFGGGMGDFESELLWKYPPEHTSVEVHGCYLIVARQNGMRVVQDQYELMRFKSV